MNSFLIKLAIALLAYFLFHALIYAVVKDTKANEIFNVILIIAYSLCFIWYIFTF